MSNNYLRSDLVMEWAKVFHWAEKRHFQLAIHGVAPKRHRRTEIDLRRLSERKKLRTARYGKKLVYALPRTTKNFDEFEMMSKIRHGLACTECLVRFYRSRIDGEIIAERFFRGCGSVPEWGIRYPDGKLLLSEISMKSNFEYTELMNGKLNAYDRNIEKIEEKFQAKAIVVFVIDISRERVERYVRSLKREKGPYWFTDLRTFLSVPLTPQGNQLTAPIYYWLDGKEYPLKKND